MNVLLFSRYSSLGASSRVRSFQYIPYLEECGLRVSSLNLLEDQDLKDLYGKGRYRPGRMIAAYWRRARQILEAGEYDLVWIEKELFPWLPAWGERFLGKIGIPFVVDYDDAIFHRYELHANPFVRKLLGKKVDRIMNMSSLVIAGNDYLADRARGAGAKRIAVIPSVVDLNHYSRESSPPSGNNDIGWIGTPGTVNYINAVLEPLIAVCKAHGVRLVTIGARVPRRTGLPSRSLPWSYETEAALIRRFSIGIMPLLETPWERGKCGYKLIQYMAAGLPVVASDVGMNRDVVDHGTNGFLAKNDRQWREALTTLILDPALRKQMGAAGRKKVEGGYSVQATRARVADLLMQAGGKGAACVE